MNSKSQWCLWLSIGALLVAGCSGGKEVAQQSEPSTVRTSSESSKSDESTGSKIEIKKPKQARPNKDTSPAPSNRSNPRALENNEPKHDAVNSKRSNPTSSAADQGIALASADSGSEPTVGKTKSGRSAPKLGRPATPTGKTGTELGDKLPEITGKDVDGVRFSLSDYDGKVKMVDFWGDW